jgi:hypothetical protein
LDVCVGNLVTVVEGIDFTDVAARPANSDAGIFAIEIVSVSGCTMDPRLLEMRGRMGESEGLAWNEKSQKPQ